MLPKKKTKRKNTRWPALNPQVNLKIRKDELEIDYLDKLSDKEKDWLNKFNEEYVNGSFEKKKKNRLHKTKKAELECYKRNNDRNNDVLAKGKVKGVLLEEKKVFNQLEVRSLSTNNHDVENSLIEKIDLDAELNVDADYLLGWPSDED